LKHGARVRFHHGTSELLGRVTLSSGAELAPGARGHVRIRLESPSVLSRGDRFILRAYSPAITIAGGEVLDPQPPRGGARTEAGRQRFSAIDASVDIDRVAFQFVGEAGSKGLSRRELGARTALWGETASQLLARLEQQGRARDLGTVIVACAVIEELARDTISDLEQHHRAEPLSEGLPREELRTRRFSRAPDVLFEHVLSRLVREGRVSGRDRLALASHRVELSPAEQHARTMIEDAIRSAGLKPASPSELSFSLHLGSSLVDRMVKLLVRQKLLVRVDDLLFHAEALAQLKGNLQRLKTGAQPPRVDVAAFKEMFGISRKYAIPLLEYLDRERVTKRVGDGRIVL
jgi:selenocysteine-specific elongation factor